VIPVSLDHVDHFPSIRSTHRRFRSNLGVAVPLIPERFSYSKHPQAPPSTPCISPPQGWHPEMTDFTLDLISKGEKVTSTLIRLEKKWSHMVGYIDLIWLEHVAQRISVPAFTQTVGKEDDAAVLMKIECESENREGNGEGARDVDEIDSETSDLDLDVIRETYNNYKQQEVERKRRQLEEGIISRVKVDWCCRCKITTTFAEGKCTEQYCEHKRCRHCCNLDIRG